MTDDEKVRGMLAVLTVVLALSALIGLSIAAGAEGLTLPELIAMLV